MALRKIVVKPATWQEPKNPNPWGPRPKPAVGAGRKVVWLKSKRTSNVKPKAY